MREMSQRLEARVLEALDHVGKGTELPGVPPAECRIVCPEYRQGAEQSDKGTGWHDLSLEDQRACRITFAALELQDYLQRITGVRIPISADASGDTTAIELVAGDQPRSDGFEIVRTGSGIRLTGNNPRSLLYAIYDFLEAQGCRWFGLEVADQVVPKGDFVLIPEDSRQTPSFPIRHFHAHLENRASASMLDWFGKNRLNTWGADNDRLGQRSRGIEIFGGNHWLIHEAGFDRNFDIGDPAQRKEFLEAVIELAANGKYRDLDFIDYIGEDWGKRVDSKGMAQLGSPTDQDLFLLTEMQKELDKAFSDGRLNRRVRTWGWAYYDTIEPPVNPLPEGFESPVGIWSQMDQRFAIDDSASNHPYEWPCRVSESDVQYFHVHTNIEIWNALQRWPCSVGLGDYHAMARNFFLPVPFVTLLADTLPKLAENRALYYSFMHMQNGFWGTVEPMYYIMAKLLWNAGTDAGNVLADYFHHRFGSSAATAVRGFFALERAMLPITWIRSQVAKRIDLVVLQDLKEPFWMWGDYFTREDLVTSICDLALVKEAIAKLDGDDPGNWLWADQIEYADAMQKLYLHIIDVYEAARQFGLWHFCRDAAASFNCVCEQLRRLAGVDLPRWNRNIHYYPRRLMEQTLIGCALERMSLNLGIPLPDEAHTTGTTGVHVATNAGKLLTKELWRHGDERPLKVGLGNYMWYQPYVDAERVYIAGQDKESRPQRSVLRCLDLSDGSVIWEVPCEDVGHSALQNVYMGMDRNSDGRIRRLTVRECYANPHRSSALVCLDASDGRELWRFEEEPAYPLSGNGAAQVVDVDGDGRLEVIDSAVEYVACLDLETGNLKWRFDDHIKVCHGVTAIHDIDGDGRFEIILGGEYNDADGNSSVVALRDDGTLMWRNGGHPHDLGSTRTHVMDVDGDGKPEILHSSLELLGQRRLPHSDLYCWNADGTLRYRVPFGGREASIADFDGDGRLEAVSTTNCRDGGFKTKPAIVCLDVATGEKKWEVPIRRHYIDDDLRVIADFDGDGLPEALLFTAHQGGYGHVSGQPTWCDAYIVKGSGEIIWQAELGDMSYAALIGLPESPRGLVIASGDGIIRLLENE